MFAIRGLGAAWCTAHGKSTMENLITNLSQIQAQVTNSTAENNDALYVSCLDLLEGLRVECRRSDPSISHQQGMNKVLSALLKTLRLRKRKSDTERRKSVEQLINFVQELMKEWNFHGKGPCSKTGVDDDDPSSKMAVVSSPGLPTSVHEYQRRLEQHGKELYKHPPTLPPPTIIVAECANPSPPPFPQRDNATMRLSFFVPFEECSSTSLVTKPTAGKRKNAIPSLIADFHPNVTPDEVLLEGAFGGTYFRDIHSAVTNVSYIGRDVIAETLPAVWLKKFNQTAISSKLTSSVYRTSVNKFKVRCGGSLGMWESSGWISDADPYGWFQWYCRFYCGRRSSDDARQIARWKSLAGPKGRFKSQLCNKILQQASLSMGASSNSKEQRRKALSDAVHDVSISPVIRQTLFHWGLLITDEVLENHQRSK